MKKRIVSLLCVLALCLGLLPVTALAEGEDAPGMLYVGGQVITSGYWTSSDGGTTWNSQNDKPSGDSYIQYDGNGTLTLHNVTITGTSSSSESLGAGIYAVSRANSDVALTINLEETSTVSGDYGVCVQANQVPSSAGNSASLTISGDGTLIATGSSSHGIAVFGYNGGATLTIEDASVDAKTTVASSNYACVYVHSGIQASNSPEISLTVKGGSLTASGGSGNSKGIWFYVGSPSATNAATSLTVSGNAIVDAKTGGIRASDTNSDISNQIKVSSSGDGNNGGIVWDGTEGTVYGDVTLDESLTINEGETLTIPKDASLTVPEGTTLTNNGTVTVEEGGTLDNKGSLVCNHHSGGTATCTQKAKCSLCGEEYGDYAPHTLTKTEAKAATCTESGNSEYWTCDTCGKYFSDANGNTEIAQDSWIIRAIGHDWNDAVYAWSDDGSTCTAARTCKHDSAHTETSTATVTDTQTKAPTCTEKGETTYTATFEADWAVTQTKVLAGISATGHSYENGKCKVCGAADPNYKPSTWNDEPAPTPVPAPTIVSGAEAVWRKGSGVGLTFTSDADFAGFQGVMVDGAAISPQYYTAKAGSTVVTLNASYLETLAAGEHTVAILSDTGTAGARFTIAAGASAAQTGDNSAPALWLGLLAASGLVLAGTAALDRKKKKNEHSA